MAFCKQCGAQLNDGAQFCPKCGQQTDAVNQQVFHPQQNENRLSTSHSMVTNQVNNQIGKLHIIWDGKLVISDKHISVSVNGIDQGDYNSFKDGFEISVPITSNEMIVEIKMKNCPKTKTKLLIMDSSKDYSYNLHYNGLAWGKFGYIFYDSDGGQIESDKLSIWWNALFYLIPIIGLGYAFCVRRTKPTSSLAAFSGAIAGVLMWWLIRLIRN